MNSFFENKIQQFINSPNNSRIWWHSIPLPNGDRIRSCHEDQELQFQMWNALQIDNSGGLKGKKVLDIGANDGFFSIAASMAGASEVTSVDKNWETWPKNLKYISKIWNVDIEIITADFRNYDFNKRYDVIFFFGVLYHLEDVFTSIKKLKNLLEDDGVLYIETQMSQLQSNLPLFEYASDIYPTIAIQDKKYLDNVGISNYLFPNESAIYNLAYSYDFDCDSLGGKKNRYSQNHPSRQIFKFIKKQDLKIRLTSDDLKSRDYLSGDWSLPETIGTWTDGTEANLSIPLDSIISQKHSNIQVKITAVPFLHERHPQQIIDILIAGKPLTQWTYSFSKSINSSKTLTIPVALIQQSNCLDLTLKILTPISPEAVGFNNDTRKLGIMVQLIEITGSYN
ncbi:class I SAM-dependent methyltransferase [Cyanobacterium stanieri LEGE 03274]|uniref:Class I SAM-dependent methyltransferase n=1 Tax=Cyanobacterium stanieri LEGE 03274 TaxID=1828756 RepID=A0ABR9V1D9_9CHRO|nr:class I SAM-dependent methyltransferase [Cyanobacterium stanieri]MBE9221714.1 class I SAM-dependent methyltransferase [Cyanobacterium stanieri LEGE 03274]